MQCESIQEQISMLLDHELSVAEAQQIFSHLGTCAECAGFYSASARISKRLRRLEQSEYPSVLDARIRKAAGAQRTETARSPRYLPNRLSAIVRRRIVLPIPAAVAVFIVSLGLGLLLVRSVAPGFLPIEKETKIVVAYPPVEVVADDETITN